MLTLQPSPAIAERNERMRALRREGATVQELMAMFGLSEPSVSNITSIVGHEQRNVFRRKVNGGLAHGLSAREIADKYDLPYDRVQNYILKYRKDTGRRTRMPVYKPMKPINLERSRAEELPEPEGTIFVDGLGHFGFRLLPDQAERLLELREAKRQAGNPDEHGLWERQEYHLTRRP